MPLKSMLTLIQVELHHNFLQGGETDQIQGIDSDVTKMNNM